MPFLLLVSRWILRKLWLLWIGLCQNQLKNYEDLWVYYRRFVAHYASIATPLTQLLLKDSFVWTDHATEAFAKLKSTLTQTPVLALLNFAEPFFVQTDASGLGVGTVLSQQNRPYCIFQQTIVS